MEAKHTARVKQLQDELKQANAEVETERAMHKARVKQLQYDLKQAKAEVETERAMRIDFEGRARELEAKNRRLRGTRLKPGDELY